MGRVDEARQRLWMLYDAETQPVRRLHWVQMLERIDYAKGSTETLVAAFEELARKQPDSVHPLTALAWLNSTDRGRDHVWLERAAKIDIDDAGLLWIFAERSSETERLAALTLAAKRDETGIAAAELAQMLQEYGRFDEASEAVLTAPLEPDALWAALQGFGWLGRFDTCEALVEILASRLGESNAQVQLVRGLVLEFEGKTEGAIEAYLQACEGVEPLPAEPNGGQQLPVGTEFLLQRDRRLYNDPLKTQHGRGPVFLKSGNDMSMLNPTLDEASTRRLALGMIEGLAAANPKHREAIADALNSLGLPEAVTAVIRVAEPGKVEARWLKLDEHDAVAAWRILQGGPTSTTDAQKDIERFRDSHPNLAFAAAILEFRNSTAPHVTAATLADLAESVLNPSWNDLKGLALLAQRSVLIKHPEEWARLAALVLKWARQLEDVAPGQQRTVETLHFLRTAMDKDRLDLFASLIEIEFEGWQKAALQVDPRELTQQEWFPPDYPGGINPSLRRLFRDSVSGGAPTLSQIPSDRFEAPELKFLVATAKRDPQLFEKTLTAIAKGDSATPDIYLLAAAAAEKTGRDSAEIFALVQAGLAIPLNRDTDPERDALIQQLLKWRLMVYVGRNNQKCGDDIKQVAREFTAEVLANRPKWTWTNYMIQSVAKQLRVPYERPKVPQISPPPGFALKPALYGRAVSERVHKAIGKSDMTHAASCLAAGLAYEARNVLASKVEPRALSKELQLLSDRSPKLAEAALANIEPDERASSRRWAVFGAASELLDQTDAAAVAYETALSQAPKNDAVRLRLIRLTAATDPDQTARLAVDLRFDTYAKIQMERALLNAPKETLARVALQILKSGKAGDALRERWVKDVWNTLQRDPAHQRQEFKAQEALCREMLSRKALRSYGFIGMIDIADVSGLPVLPDLWSSLLAELTAPSGADRIARSPEAILPRSIEEVAAEIAASDRTLGFELKAAALRNPAKVRGLIELHRAPEAAFIEQAHAWLDESGDFANLFNIWRVRGLEIDLVPIISRIAQTKRDAPLEVIPRWLIDQGQHDEAMRFVDGSVGQLPTIESRLKLLLRFANEPDLTWPVLAKLERMDGAAASSLPPFSSKLTAAEAQQLLGRAPFWTDPEHLNMLDSKRLGLGRGEPSAFNHFAKIIRALVKKEKDESLKNFMIEASGDTFGGRVFRGIVFWNPSYIAEAVRDYQTEILALPPERQDALALALEEELLIAQDPVSRAWITSRLGARWTKQQTAFLALSAPPASNVEAVELYAQLRDLHRIGDADAIFKHAISLQPTPEKADYARELHGKIRDKLGKRGWGWRQLPLLARYANEPWAYRVKIRSEVERLGGRWFFYLNLNEGTLSDKVERLENQLPYLDSACSDLKGPERAYFLLFLARFGETRELARDVHAAYLDLLASKLDSKEAGPTLVGDLYHMLQRDPEFGEGRIGAYFGHYLDPAWPIHHREAVIRAHYIGETKRLDESLVEPSAQFVVDYLNSPDCDSTGSAMQWAISAVVEANAHVDPEIWNHAARKNAAILDEIQGNASANQKAVPGFGPRSCEASCCARRRCGLTQ